MLKSQNRKADKVVGSFTASHTCTNGKSSTRVEMSFTAKEFKGMSSDERNDIIFNKYLTVSKLLSSCCAKPARKTRTAK